MASVFGTDEGSAYAPPPLKDKWAARKFLADDAEDIIERRRAGIVETPVLDAERDMELGELPMLAIPER